MGLFNRNKKTDLEKAAEYLEREYPKAENDFNKALEKSNKQLDEMTNKVDEEFFRLTREQDKADQEMDKSFNRIDSTLIQSSSVDIPDYVRDYWVNGAESANYAKNMSPEEQEAAERYLEQLMQEENEEEKGRSR